MKNLILPISVLAMFASMLFPLPSGVLDILLVTNLILSLLLLVSALYITKPIKLSSLPTILLLATLFRLALNVSTTRMILGSNTISKTIEAFGKVVIQGNLVVGIVVFLIITLVQFIVIAKGSERVAEVSARFTLDAMPGKQMSIDADVRSGLIDFKTAKEKREELQTESRFYGALDGAMKFVKGDAIAGLIITAINIIGGLAVGIFINHMDIQSAISKYTLLTIGDGLLAQIPAFLNSLAAGMIITRVSDDKSSLASQIPEQLGQLKEPKIIISIISLLLALIPGMPAVPFLLIGAFFFLSFLASNQKSQIESVSHEVVNYIPRIEPTLLIVFNTSYLKELHNINLLKLRIEEFRKYAFEKWGIILSTPEIKTDDSVEKFEVKIKGLNVNVEKDFDLKDGGVRFVDALKKVLDNNILEFIDDNETKKLLDFYESTYQDLVNRVVPDIISVTKLTLVLKSLIEEDISIKHFDMILQGVAELDKDNINKQSLIANVRESLKRVISLKYASSDFKLNVILLDPVIDLEFMKAAKEIDIVSDESFNSIVRFFDGVDVEGKVLLTSKDARLGVFDFITLQNINIPVLAHEEIIKDVKLQVCGTIVKLQLKEAA
ncbi:MAG: flagellar biosynthesis protein FlhA [Bdellovibrionota bacterium]